jgi:MFS family permease
MTSLKSNIWKFYLITFLGIRFITPIRIIYLLSFGLSFAQIGMMELAAAIVIVILEIPSGIFADLVGRKASRLIAYALSIGAFSLLSFGSTAYIFILGWALSGAADAFESGAQNALIFDTLKVLGKEKEYIKIKSHFFLINTFSIIVGSLVGIKLYMIDPRLPWYLVTLTIIISALVFSTVKEPIRAKKLQKFSSHLRDFKKSFVSSISNIDVKRLILLGIILAVLMYVFTTLLNQPYLVSRGFSVESLGIVFAIITGVSGIAAFFTPKLEGALKKRVSFFIIFVSFSLLLVLMGLIKSQAVLLLVLLFTIVDAYKSILIDNYINQVIDSESRATVLSVQSFVNNIAISLLFVFIGYLVDIFSMDVVLISMGIFVGVCCIPFLTVSNRLKKVKLH